MLRLTRFSRVCHGPVEIGEKTYFCPEMATKFF
jgi:hypothetical protein